MNLPRGLGPGKTPEKRRTIRRLSGAWSPDALTGGRFVEDGYQGVGCLFGILCPGLSCIRRPAGIPMALVSSGVLALVLSGSRRLLWTGGNSGHDGHFCGAHILLGVLCPGRAPAYSAHSSGSVPPLGARPSAAYWLPRSAAFGGSAGGC